MDILDIQIAKNYANQLAEQFGSLKGAPCTIKSITKDDKTSTVIFEWENEDGTKQQTSMFVQDGQDAELIYVELQTKWINGKYAIVDKDENVLTYNDIVDLYQNQKTFVYCVHTNVITLPSFKEDEGFAFTGTYTIRDKSHIIRVIINSSNDIHTDDVEVEDVVNKRSRITESNKTSIDFYPSIKAVVDYIDGHVSETNKLYDVPYTEQQILNSLMNTPNVKLNGFFYNSNVQSYCSYEGIYMSKKVSGETIHFGYCEIRGIHESNYACDYRMDWEYGDVWYKHENQNIYKTSINFDVEGLTIDTNYSYYAVRNGIVFYQLRVKTDNTLAHGALNVLPYNLFGDYIYNEKLSNHEEGVYDSVLRISGTGDIQVTLGRPNTWVLFNGSYPMAY